MARDQAKTENESVKVDSQSVEEAIERLEKSSASERARIMDKHNADEIDLPIKIQQNRRAKFSHGEYRFTQACKKNDPIMALEAILLEARVCNPDQGHQPGNPQHFQSPDISLDDHWEKTKESARELTAMHSEARWHANKAAQAIADNDTARAVCFALAASRWVTEMKLLQVAAAELEGIRVAVGRKVQDHERNELKGQFQAECQAYWKKRPGTEISGVNGIVSIVKEAFQDKDGREMPKHPTLVSWAREVAPPEVKRGRGRPPGSKNRKGLPRKKI